MERTRPTRNDLPLEKEVETSPKGQLTPAERKLAHSLLADQIWGRVTNQIITEQEAAERASLPKNEGEKEL